MPTCRRLDGSSRSVSTRLQEFPTDEPFVRVPGGGSVIDGLTLLSVLKRCLTERPYERWFATFEPLLNALGTSCYPDAAGAALYADPCM